MLKLELNPTLTACCVLSGISLTKLCCGPGETQENKTTHPNARGATSSQGRAGSWLMEGSLLWPAGQTSCLAFQCGNNVAGFLGPQPLFSQIPCSATPGPPTLGLAGTKSCNLISGSETKDPFSIPLPRRPPQGLWIPLTTCQLALEAWAESVHAVPHRWGACSRARLGDRCVRSIPPWAWCRRGGEGYLGSGRQMSSCGCSTEDPGPVSSTIGHLGNTAVAESTSCKWSAGKVQREAGLSE